MTVFRILAIFLVSTFFLYGCGGGGSDTPRVLISSIEFTDANLAICVSDTGFTYVDEVTSLECSGKSISDLTGIDSLTSLTYLNFGCQGIACFEMVNQIVDISPLSTLISLTELNLSSNQIVDISPLNSLTNLAALNLQDNNGILCEDLDALEALLVDCDIARDEEGTCNPGSGVGDDF